MSNKYDTEFNAQQRHADYIRKAVDALQGAPVPTEGRSDLAAPSDEPFSDFWDDAKVADQPEDAALRKRLNEVSKQYFVQYGTARFSAYLDDLMQLVRANEQEKAQTAVYGFHQFIIGKDIIRPEADQAFNYARLHRALDAYIAELTQPPAADTTKQGEGESDE